MLYVKADTQTKIPVGPFVDATDDVTPETGVTLGAADAAELIKHDGSAVTDISGNTFTAITGADGMYNLTLTAAQLDTEGRMTIYIADTSVCKPVKQEIMVVNANVFDSLFAAAGTDYLQSDAVQANGNAMSGFLSGTTAFNSDITKINGTAGGAANLDIAGRTMQAVTVGTGSTTTIIETNLTETTNDHYNGRRLVFATGNLAGQATDITDYNGASKQLTVTALTEAPANSDVAIIV